MPANTAIGFNKRGQFTALPTVFLEVNADALDLRPQVPTGILAILAEGTGFFAPKVPSILPFDVGSPERFLAPSPLLTAATLAVPTFPGLGRGAGRIYVVPVTPATPATMTIDDGAGTDLLTLTSKGWGALFNAILVKSEAGVLTITLPTATSTVIERYPYATVQALVDDITARSAIVTAAFLAEDTPDTFADTAMAGGTSPAAGTADWADALTALDAIRVNVLAPITADQTIWGMVSTYCDQKRSRAVVGGDAVQSWNGAAARAAADAALKAEAAVLNSRRLLHCGLGANGLAGKFLAARYAALACAVEPSQPMTFQDLGVQSLEAQLTDVEVGGEEGLLVYGVAPPIQDPAAPGRFIVSRGLSTASGANLYDREWSVLAAIDALHDLLKQRLQQFLGGEGTVGAIKRAVVATAQILEEATRPESTVRILSYRREAIVATFMSDTVLRITCAVTPILPINFIDVILNLERTEITVPVDVNLAA